MKLHFLEASIPLTKRFSLVNKQVEKTSYPNVYEVTSHEVQVNSLKDFETALRKHAASAHCLVKGELNRPLVSESRAGSTDTNGSTQWLCLDIDGLPTTYQEPDVEVPPRPDVIAKAKAKLKAATRDAARFDDAETHEALDKAQAALDTAHKPSVIPGATHQVTPAWVLQQLGLKDYSYIIQWSASYGIVDDLLRCHIFLMLDKPHPAPLIKQWLMEKNLTVPCLTASLALTKTGNALHWPLDISACQNDKLIYIAPPVLRGIKDPLGKQPRIALVKRAKERVTLPVSTIASVAKNREMMIKQIDRLRSIEGLPKRRTTFKVHGSLEVMARPDTCVVTEMKEERGFVYFNLNGGDSWGYYHPENNPEFIYNFKGEPVYLTKELLPDYWEQLHQAVNKPNSQGVIKLAFRDPKSDKYWCGTYDTLTDNLNIEPTASVRAVLDHCKSNGIPLYDQTIPEWNLVFDPHDNVRVDIANRTVNLFQPSIYMRTQAKQVTQIPKTIYKVIFHMVGSDVEVFERFINWLAYVLQTRDRALTAWVFHGIPGTGKGTFLTKILKPLFGPQHVAIPRMQELEREFNSFIQHSLIVAVDEIEVDALQNERGVMADIRRYITEEEISLRDMYRSAKKIRNYSAWFFFSNALAPVRIPRGDRRMNVGKFQTAKLVISDKERDRIEHELQAFHDYLLYYPVNREDVFTPLLNEDREQMMALTESSIDTVSSALIDGTMQVFIDMLPTDNRYTGDPKLVVRVEDYKNVIHDILKRTDRNTGACNIARDELRAIYEYTVGKIPESPNKFTSLIKHHRIHVTKVWVENRAVNGIKVIWKDIAKWTDYLAGFAPKTAPVKTKLSRVK